MTGQDESPRIGGTQLPAADPCVDSELALAHKIEDLLFPKSSPLCTWCCIGVRNQMADELGGDYFDFITMPDGCQTLFIGDVTGHGLHASIVMSLVYGYLHRATQGECDPVGLISQVNRFLTSFARRSQALDHFFSSTLFFGIIDPVSLEMVYVNAGHVPPLVRRGGEITPLDTTAQPVGFFDDLEINSGRFRFAAGDRLLLYTDGIVESANSSGELFGSDRLRETLRTATGDDAEFLDILFNRLQGFGGGVPADDDCTAIVVDFNSFRPASAPRGA